MIKTFIHLGVIFLAAGLAPCASAQLPDVPAGTIEVRLNRITEDLGETIGGTPQVVPIDYSVIPDGSGRAIVGTLGGVLRVVEQNGTLHSAALDTTADPVAQSVLASNGEYGLHSVAVHPDYNDVNSPGYQKFYSLNSRNTVANATFEDGITSNHQDVLVEWTMTQLDATTFTATSREIFDIDQPGQSHNVVDLTFDGNGLLHVASGDGGGNNSVNGNQSRSVAAQDPRNVYGSILRIDPTDPNHANANLTGKTVSGNGAYSIPDSNHFAADADVNTLPEIMALGLRSPFRMNFDSTTGDLFIGNVGEGRVESIFRIGNGDNAQWGRKEGSLDFNTSISLESTTNPIGPAFEFDHSDGRSIVGGFIYHGTAIPELIGKYVFGDLG